MIPREGVRVQLCFSHGALRELGSAHRSRQTRGGQHHASHQTDMAMSATLAGFVKRYSAKYIQTGRSVARVPSKNTQQDVTILWPNSLKKP